MPFDDGCHGCLLGSVVGEPIFAIAGPWRKGDDAGKASGQDAGRPE